MTQNELLKSYLGTRKITANYKFDARELFDLQKNQHEFKHEIDKKLLDATWAEYLSKGFKHEVTQSQKNQHEAMVTSSFYILNETDYNQLIGMIK